MPGIIGRKVGMTSIYSAEGKATPCTVIEAGPCVVTQLKTQERDGYDAKINCFTIFSIYQTNFS